MIEKFVCLGLLSGMCLSVAVAEDAPLQPRELTSPEPFRLFFKPLDAQTAFHAAEGYCTVVILTETKPEEITKEPYAQGKKLYARLFAGEQPVVLGDNFPTPPTMASWGQPVTVMRLTEREMGEGFDTAIIDLNNNGDLTDDPILRDHKLAKYRKFFGPFTLTLPEGTLPEGSMIRPIMYLESGFMSGPRSYLNPKTDKFVDFVGFAALRNGWALEGTLDADGVRQRIAFRDAYCDFTFSQNVSHREIINDDLFFDNAKKASSIEFFPSDYVLRDYNNNGRYDCELPLNECEPFGKYLSVGGKLYTWVIASDMKSCSLAAVPESETGFYTAKATDKRTQVALMTGYTAPADSTGTFLGDGKWQLITLDGNIRKSALPAGDYILSQFALRSRDADRMIAHFALDDFAKRDSIAFKIEAGKEFSAPWGEPLKLVVDAYHPNDTTQGNTLQVYISLQGKNGETYSDFSVFNPKTLTISPLAGPRIEIVCDEKPVGSHTFKSDFLGWWWQVPDTLKGKKITLIPVYDACPAQSVTLDVQLD